MITFSQLSLAIHQHLAFICSCPTQFRDHVVLRLHYYAIIPPLILIMLIINEVPPPRVNKAIEVGGGKGVSPSNIPLEGGSGTHHGCKHGFIYKWQWMRNMLLLANFEFLVVIDCWKIRKWAKSRPGGNKAGCWILYFRPDLFRYSLC